MQFSLVVATLGRTVELERLFQSLDKQQHRDFEVILIDQNSDERLTPIVGRFKERINICHLRQTPALSRSRNLGIRHCKGQIIAFPDDDCWYGEDLLAAVNSFLTNHPERHGILGEAVDTSGKRILPWGDKKKTLTPAISWRHSVTFAYFLRADALALIGNFDEKLGPGSGTPWGCGEDNDLMLRALKTGLSIQYEPNLHINHPRLFPSFDKKGRYKRFCYSQGEGYLLRKHPMPLWWTVLFFAIPAVRSLAAILLFNLPQTHFHWVTVMGRIKGFQAKISSTQ